MTAIPPDDGQKPADTAPDDSQTTATTTVLSARQLEKSATTVPTSTAGGDSQPVAPKASQTAPISSSHPIASSSAAGPATNIASLQKPHHRLMPGHLAQSLFGSLRKSSKARAKSTGSEPGTDTTASISNSSGSLSSDLNEKGKKKKTPVAGRQVSGSIPIPHKTTGPRRERKRDRRSGDEPVESRQQRQDRRRAEQISWINNSNRAGVPGIGWRVLPPGTTGWDDGTSGRDGDDDGDDDDHNRRRSSIANLDPTQLGRTVRVRARVHTIHILCPGLAFVVLRQAGETIQAVVHFDATALAPPDQRSFLTFARLFLRPETLVSVQAAVVEPGNRIGRVNSTTVHHVELRVVDIVVLAGIDTPSFSVHVSNLVDQYNRRRRPKDDRPRRHTRRRDEDQDGSGAGGANTTTKSENQARKEKDTDKTDPQEESSKGAETRGNDDDDDESNDKIDAITYKDRAANRIIDLRTASSGAIMRIQSAISDAFRAHLVSNGFVELHTPKLQGAATESGAAVFRVDYFGRNAFLAQSPQLAKQMAIAGDLGRVFEVGPVFRAENSNTKRHLTEFTGLDIEMALDDDYGELLTTLDRLFRAIFSHVRKTCKNELDAVRQRFPHKDLLIPDVTPILTFKEAIQLLNSAPERGTTEPILPEDEDLSKVDEKRLGNMVRKKYKSDFFAVDKFPVEARPFYAMPDPNTPGVTNSFDFFLRGQEILSGGQRVHEPEMLRQQMAKAGIDPAMMAEYMAGFEFGAPPHGGGGIGLERLLFLLLDLDNIRLASFQPRDPASFPVRLIDTSDLLRYPGADTRKPECGSTKPPVEQLIANYGDAANTSWLEERIQIWRDEVTGGVIGYAVLDGHAVVAGNPLCHRSQYEDLIERFLAFAKEKKLKPFWLIAAYQVAEVLAKHGWMTMAVTAEQRLDPSDPSRKKSKSLNAKLAKVADKLVFKDYSPATTAPEHIWTQLDTRLKDWLRSRQGKKQVHLTDVNLKQDLAHRTLHIAIDSSTGEIAAMVTMAQLAPMNGLQVKYSLDFPDSPSGSIEALLVHALNLVEANPKMATSVSGTARPIAVIDEAVRAGAPVSAAAGRNLCVTFGSGATSHFTPGKNVSSVMGRILELAYAAINSSAHLTNKSNFRRKLGTVEDLTWVCSPTMVVPVPVLIKFFTHSDRQGRSRHRRRDDQVEGLQSQSRSRSGLSGSSGSGSGAVSGAMSGAVSGAVSGPMSGTASGTASGAGELSQVNEAPNPLLPTTLHGRLSMLLSGRPRSKTSPELPFTTLMDSDEDKKRKDTKRNRLSRRLVGASTLFSSMSTGTSGSRVESPRPTSGSSKLVPTDRPSSRPRPSHEISNPTDREEEPNDSKPTSQ